MESCTLKPQVINERTGEYESSVLFDDLKDLKQPEDVYHTLRKKEFKDKLPSSMLDARNEPKLEKVAPIIGISTDSAEQSILDSINKQIQSGVYSYQEALQRVTDYNSSSPRDGYMATMVMDGKNRYKIFAVKNTEQQKETLRKQIESQELVDSIIKQIEKVGGSIEFITEGKSKYDSTEADKLFKGLKALVSLNTSKNVSEEAAHEAGHVAIGVLGNAPIIERLLNLLRKNPEYLNNILSDYGYDNVGNTLKLREAAGEIVGEAILKRIDKKSPLGRLVDKILSFVKQLFYKVAGNDVQLLKLKAENIAGNIALNFMTKQEGMNLDNVKQNPEVLFHEYKTVEFNMYSKLLNQLNDSMRDLKNMSAYSTQKLVKKLMLDIESYGRRNRDSLLSTINEEVVKDLALEGAVETLEGITRWFSRGEVVDTLLQGINIDSNVDFEELKVGWANRIHQLDIIFSTVAEVLEIVEKSIGDISVSESAQLSRVLNNLREATAIKSADFHAFEVKFFLKWVENTFGQSYIETASRIFREKQEHWYTKWWQRLRPEVKKVAIKDIIKEQKQDISLLDKWIRSMSNNPDILGQWADIQSKRAVAEANQNTLEHYNKLLELRAEFNKLGFKDTTLLFERWGDTESEQALKLEKNQLTGYLISGVKTALWEKEYYNYVYSQDNPNSIRERFKRAHPEYQRWSDTVKGEKWRIFAKREIKQWHEEHSLHDETTGEYSPNPNLYRNDAYYELMDKRPDLREWYEDKYIPLKTELDGKIPQGATRLYRAPQFRGTFVNKIKNREGVNGWFGARRKALSRATFDTFYENCDDRDFGNDKTYNPQDPMGGFNVEAGAMLEFGRRLPVYGVNLMTSLSDLSTDLFHTTLAYADMANRYDALKSIVDVMEIGRGVLARRSAGANTYQRLLGKAGFDNGYARYSKYVDKELFSIQEYRHVTHTSMGNLSWNKMMRLLSSGASKAYMGFNVLGGITNTGTGFIELHKEAIAGEYYNRKDVVWADKWYFKHLADNIWQMGIKGKDDQISLFERYFNIRNDNELNFRQFKTMHSRAYNIANASIMATYSTGDHYMQIVPFMALLHNTILYDESGNKVRASDAYEVVTNPVSGKDELKLKGTYYVSKEAYEEKLMIDSILDEFGRRMHLSTPTVMFTPEQREYLNKYGQLVNMTTTVESFLRKRLHKIVWGKQTEADLKIKAQEVGIRLHGIYNNADKTAFQQNWYGRMLLCMRQWALGMGERRFGGKHYSVSLGKDVEGSYQSFYKVLLQGIHHALFGEDANMAANGRAMIALTFLPWGKKTREVAEQLGISVNELANIKRTHLDWYAISLLAVLGPLMQLGFGAIDEDERPAEALLQYWLTRWQFEQEALSTPWGLWREKQGIFNVMPSGASFVWDILNCLAELAGLPFADKKNSFFYYQSKKKGFYEKGDTKFLESLFRLVPTPIKSWRGMKHAQTSLKSFEYQIKMK